MYEVGFKLGSNMPPRPQNSITQGIAPRYGIGEWYGQLLTGLSASDRERFAEQPREIPCPFKHADLVKPGKPLVCTKRGGVCSLRLYEQSPSGTILPAKGEAGVLRAVCPYRFHEGKQIVGWIGETLLGIPDPLIVSELGFLEPISNLPASEDAQSGDDENGEAEDTETKRDVGRLDLLLVSPNSVGSGTIDWCVVEMQAVYFSGKGMSSYFELLGSSKNMPFPDRSRRPDYRSSGPKRLMPQLQIKVPTLRRWGKKLAVVIDRGFFQALGPMDRVQDVSNCDIAWFIVDYVDRGNGRAELTRGEVRFTTLERAVEGLTAGQPVALPEFESRIREKLERRQKDMQRSSRRESRRTSR